ncbi:hypothetical protein [Bacillus sp. FSL K6-0067]|uniref:hypothetical protein n=1 Tax=Bacillus sp. FSL K6-0067 TaxID=2921412 RepID=UPI0030F8F362
MKDKTNQNDKVNIVNQKYKEEISKETLAKGMIAGALAVGAVGSMEALKPSKASAAEAPQANAVSSQGVIDSITGNIKSTEELVKASNSIYTTLGDVAFNDRAKRKNNMYNYLAQMTQQTPSYNLVLVKQSLDYKFVRPDTRANYNLGTDPSYKQVNNIKINGETYTLHAFKQAAVFRTTDPQFMNYLGLDRSGNWYQRLGSFVNDFIVHGVPNGNDMILVEGSQQNPQFDAINEIYIGQR